MNIRNIILKSLFVVGIATFIVSCKSNENEDRELKAYVSSFLKDNKKAVAFGSSTLKGILDKTNFQSNDMLAAILGDQLNKLNSAFDLDQPVYFVAEGPLDKDGRPEVLNLFLELRSEDSLRMELEDRSFVLDSVKNVRFVDDGSFVLAFDKNIAIANVNWSENEVKTSKLAKELFDRSSKEMSGGEIDEILGKEGDIVFGVSLENLYETSDTDLNKLDKDIQDEIAALVKGSFVETVARFENGAAIVETKNKFNQKLKDELFFKSSAPSGFMDKLNKGEGEMIAGVSINLDVDKMEKFYAKYSPETLEELTGMLGGANRLISAFSGGPILSKFVDGNFGFSLVGNPSTDSYSMNAYAGTTATGKELVAGLSMMPEEIELKKEASGVYGSFTSNPGSTSKAKLPKGCENFGKKGITAFVNFANQDSQEFAVKLLTKDQYAGGYRLMEIVEYATFEYDETGGRLYIKAKKGQENVLKQLFDVMMQDFAQNIAMMGM